VFSTWEGTSEAFEVAEECPNLYFDTALAYDYDMIEPSSKSWEPIGCCLGPISAAEPSSRTLQFLVEETD
jgi:hypothetical protein